jgi:hypothetical protein
MSFGPGNNLVGDKLIKEGVESGGINYTGSS